MVSQPTFGSRYTSMRIHTFFFLLSFFLAKAGVEDFPPTVQI